ncbi:threonine synthase [Candidatus Woesearchaeota archaeon]|nr:threonine synthase [Candidatus Woesearchaeota archaeon]
MGRPIQYRRTPPPTRCALCQTQGKELYRCLCGGSVEVMHPAFPRLSWRTIRARPFHHWRYHDFYIHIPRPISLGEGGTSLIHSIQDRGLHFKIEGDNPTGSFKDRGSTIEVSSAQALGARKVVLASTGNMGASVAAYAARGGLECTVYIPHNTTEEKLGEMRAFGTKLVKVRGDYTKAAATARKVARDRGGFLCGDYSLRREGEKSIAFELVDSLGSVDNVVVPMGNGTLISSLWQGFCDLASVGLLRQMPRLIGVQAQGCKPIADAFVGRHSIRTVMPRTIASAIACGDPLDGELALRALSASRGRAVVVSDKEMVVARRAMARHEGIDSEPSGAAPYAAFGKLKLPKDQVTVCVVTGHGLKDLKNV